MSRELLQQALEALESCEPADTSTGHVCWPSFDEGAVDKAITALRAALAAEQPEPMQCKFCAGFFARYRCNNPLECDCPKCQGYCKCPPAAPSVPEPPHHAACSTTRGGDCDCWYIQPAGWRLVPVEPTQEMLSALEDALNVWVQEIGEMSDVYRAMLEAAPEAPSGGEAK